MMIRAALTRPKRVCLEAIGREFGLSRLRREWSALRRDKITPLSQKHVEVVSHRIDEISKNG
jgi:hypothetical protein